MSIAKRNPSDATRKKISQSMIGDKNPMYGKSPSDDTRKKMSASHKGLTHTEEAKQKISFTKTGEKHPFFGKTHSQEVKQAMSESRKKHYKLSNENNELIEIRGLSEFCKTKSISRSALIAYSKQDKFYKGFKIL